MSKEDRRSMLECAIYDWIRKIDSGATWKAARNQIESEYQFTPEEKLKFHSFLVGRMENYQEAGAITWTTES